MHPVTKKRYARRVYAFDLDGNIKGNSQVEMPTRLRMERLVQGSGTEGGDEAWERVSMSPMEYVRLETSEGYRLAPDAFAEFVDEEHQLYFGVSSEEFKAAWRYERAPPQYQQQPARDHSGGGDTRAEKYSVAVGNKYALEHAMQALVIRWGLTEEDTRSVPLPGQRPLATLGISDDDVKNLLIFKEAAESLLVRFRFFRVRLHDTSDCGMVKTCLQMVRSPDGQLQLTETTAELKKTQVNVRR